jgi:hypothetical protein
MKALSFLRFFTKPRTVAPPNGHVDMFWDSGTGGFKVRDADGNTTPMGSSASSPRVFSVRDYGATGNGSTDDTAAINAAIAAAFVAGGGTVYFPAGHYVCSGPLDAATNSVLTCPQDIDYQLSRPTISLIGEATGWMTDGYEDIGEGGVSLDFRDATASGTMPSAIGFAPWVEVPNFANIYTEWNNVNVVIDKLTIVVEGNSLSGINCNNALTLRIGDGVAVHAAAQGPPASLLEPDLVDPSSSGSTGIIFPAVLNNITQDCGSCCVSGFAVGIKAGEHLFFKRPSIIFCKDGLLLPFSSHLISGSLSIENCRRAVATSGTTPAVINLELQVEMSDLSEWWEGVYGFQGGSDERGQIVHSSYNKATDTFPNNFPISGGSGLVFRDLRKEKTNPGSGGIVTYTGLGNVGINTTSPTTLGSGDIGVTQGVFAIYNPSGTAFQIIRGSGSAELYFDHTGAGANQKVGNLQWLNGELRVNSILDNLSGATRTMTIPIAGGLRLVTRTPASAAATGTQWDFAYDANYLYVCTATDTWKRAALSTW